MKKIPLTQGKFAIVDDWNYEWLNQWKWCANKYHNTYYAIRAQHNPETNRPTIIYMHREILGLTKGDGIVTDHGNHNGLDNQETNIRRCSNKQNIQNSLLRKDNTSGYKGVSWNRPVKKWGASIRDNGKKINLGYFTRSIDAAKVYDKKAKELFGKYAYTNFGQSRVASA